MIHQRRRPLRLIAATLAGVLALSASPLLGVAGAADALPPLANPIADGAFCDGAPTQHPFTDIGGESQATHDTIVCLVNTGITQGTTPTTYTPGGTVTRRQMALFIQRLADLFNELETAPLNDLPPYDNIPDYPDVTPLDNGAEAIGQLSQANIVGGFPDGTFRPNAPVSRRQMAAFVNRLQDFLTGSPFSTSGDFFDDDNGDPGEDNLNALASVGIFQGDGQGNVTPGGNLTRRQMANILLRYAQVLFADGLIESPFATSNETLAFTPDTAASTQALLDTGADQPADNRTYTASNLPANAGGYRITLVQASNVTNTNGDITFAEEGNTGLADAGTPSAQIITVNGAPPVPANLSANGASVGAVQPVGGTITVVIDATVAGSVIPVIYTDQGGANTRLNLDNANRPTEPFGIAGQLTVTAAASNATLNITPATAVTLELATEPSTTDDRTYTVTGLTAATDYTIQLFPAANVQGTTQFTFTEAGATNTADEGAVAADIITVNGVAQGGADDDAVAQPINGQITFVVDGFSTENIRPVIYRDVDVDGNLDLNADNTPIAAEAFGVGGAIQYVPTEATGGSPASGTVTLVSGTAFAVLNGTTTVFFNAADAYRIQGGGFYNTVTPTVFFQNLSIGDMLFTCQTNLGLPNTYTQDAANEWCLQDTAPAEPTTLLATAGTPADTSIKLDWTASATPSVGSYRVYSNDESCLNTAAGELGLLATVAAPTVTHTANGLIPATTYCFVVTAVSGADETAVAVDTPNLAGDNTVELATAGPIEAPTVLTAVLTTDEVPTGATTIGDVWTLEFSETMGSPAGATFDITDADGDTIRVVCGLAAAPADNLTSATCVQGNGANPTVNDTIVITLTEAGEDRNAGGGNDAIEYPLTITDTTVLVDADDAAEPNLGTGDVTIG